MLGLCSLGLVVVRVLMVVCRSAGGWFGHLGLCSLGLVVVRAMWLQLFLPG